MSASDSLFYPLRNGFKQFHITKKQHNELSVLADVSKLERCEYFFKDGKVIVHYYMNAIGESLSYIMLPLAYLMFLGKHSLKEEFDMLKFPFIEVVDSDQKDFNHLAKLIEFK